MILARNKNLNTNSRNLRNNSTKQENHLWYDFLKAQTYQFYRQRVIGNYIVDFYCPTLKLVIELDGSQHYEVEAIEYDKNRTDYLESLEIKVIRFTNKDVNSNFSGVCEIINKIILTALQGTDNPQSPAGDSSFA